MADLLEQFPAGGADKLIAVNFTQNHAAGAGDGSRGCLPAGRSPGPSLAAVSVGVNV